MLVGGGECGHGTEAPFMTEFGGEGEEEGVQNVGVLVGLVPDEKKFGFRFVEIGF